MAVDESYSPMASQQHQQHQDMIGTPVRLAPAGSVFRKGGPTPPALATPISKPGSAPPQLGGGGQASPSKGMIGQMSDLIFGW